MSFTPIFDGLALDDTNGIKVEKVKDFGPVTVKMEPTLGGGSGLRRANIEGRTIRLSGTISADTAATLETRLDTLLQKLHQADAKVLQISDDRYLDAWASPDGIKWDGGTAGTVARWSCKFTSKSPYWRASAESTDTLTNSSGTGSQSVVVDNTGATAPSWPTFEIAFEGDISGTLTLGNSTTSKEVEFADLNVMTGDTLIINTENGQIYIETPANASSYTPNKITGAFWPLEPGNNTVVMTVTWGSGSDSDMTIKWYEQHHHMGDLG